MNELLQLTDTCFLSPQRPEGGLWCGPMSMPSLYMAMQAVYFGWKEPVGDWITEHGFMSTYPGLTTAALQIKLRAYNPAIDDFLETNPAFYLVKK